MCGWNIQRQLPGLSSVSVQKRRWESLQHSGITSPHCRLCWASRVKWIIWGRVGRLLINPICLSLLKVVSVCYWPLFGLGLLCGNQSPDCNLLKSQKRPELVPVFVFSFRLCSLISHSKQVQHWMGCLPVAVLVCLERHAFTHFCNFPVSSSHWPIVNASLAFCFM